MADSSTTTIPIELLKKYDRPGPRYTSYPTAPVWRSDYSVEDYTKDISGAAVRKETPLSLYCHIPFCRSRCFYCGCNTCVANQQKSVVDYLNALDKEIDQVAQMLGPRRVASQLHFGGGTPTYLTVEQLGQLIDGLENRFQFTPECERSIEVDPRVTSEEQLKLLASRGFNRISFGVQDLDPNVQEAIGRVQPEEMVSGMINLARELGFDGINIDLIYGLPRQTVKSFTTTLKKAIALRPDRVAVYSFAYLPEAKANQRKINESELPSAEEKYQLFAAAIESFTAAEYRQIGMDHFALPGDELSRAQQDGRLHRNFMGYTVQSAPEMIGFGMSSIGYVNDAFIQNISKLNAYGDSIREHGVAVFRGFKLSKDDLIRQYTITQLMCNFRLRYDELQARFGVSYNEYFADAIPNLKPFLDDHFLVESNEELVVTPLGRTFVRNIAMAFDAYLDGGPKTTFSRTI